MSKREIIIQQAVDEQLHTLPFQKPFVDRPNSATIIMDAVMQIQRLEKQHKKRRRRRRGPRVLVANYRSS
jgi:hypothetical protein